MRLVLWLLMVGVENALSDFISAMAKDIVEIELESRKSPFCTIIHMNLTNSHLKNLVSRPANDC